MPVNRPQRDTGLRGSEAALQQQARLSVGIWADRSLGPADRRHVRVDGGHSPRMRPVLQTQTLDATGSFALYSEHALGVSYFRHSPRFERYQPPKRSETAETRPAARTGPSSLRERIISVTKAHWMKVLRILHGKRCRYVAPHAR